MKKSLPITLLIASSLLHAKDISPEDLLQNNNNIVQEADQKNMASSDTQTSAVHKPSPGDFFRNLGELFDNAEAKMQQSFASINHQFDSLWESTKTRADNVKRAVVQNSPLTIQDEQDHVALIAHIGDIAQDNDISMTVEDNTFRVELKKHGLHLQITGVLNNNVLTAQIAARKERTTKDGVIESTFTQNSVIQQTVMGQLELDKLAAEFTQTNQTLTITLPKKVIPEKKARKIEVTIR